MDVFEAIYTRQSIGQVKPDPVPRASVEKLLAAAVQAPNHHKIRPWRFVVLAGQSRERLGEVMAASLGRRDPQAPPAALAAERAKPLRAPVLIAVSADKPGEPKVDQIENICAAACAAQNILLAARALGLAAMWRTGPAATDPAVKTFLGLAPDQPLIAFIYVGYPLATPEAPARLSFEDRTAWME